MEIISFYSGFRKQELRRTSYAGETNNTLHIARLGSSSNSEPKLYRRQTLIRNKNRVSDAESCKTDGKDTEVKPANKRLRKMKAQSKKTFKFRKTRRRDFDEESPDKENLESSSSPVKECATTSTNTVTTFTPSTSKSSGLRPASLTATVIRRAKQRKKSSHKAAVEILVDDDSISSNRTSSTVGYRDSFGDNDDGCFHLLERYDDSGAVMRLLQSRQRSREQGEGGRETTRREEEAVTPIVELDTEQEEAEETDISSFVIFEHQDENTLI